MVQVAPGDVVVLGSDGLWDNLSDEEILEEVRQGLAVRERASALAHRLAAAAFGRSLDRGSQTPYSLGASEAFDMVYSGARPKQPRKMMCGGV
jgi:protein phosphatase PTC7